MSKWVNGAIQALIVVGIAAGVLYVLFAFMCWSFEPGTWPALARIAFATLWFIWVAAALSGLTEKKQ